MVTALLLDGLVRLVDVGLLWWCHRREVRTVDAESLAYFLSVHVCVCVCMYVCVYVCMCMSL